MQNQLEMEAVSVRLYKYLCEEVVGSKNIVRYRRLYYKLYDDMSTDIYYELISSGSKAEGLDLPGSDFDIMMLLKLWEVYEDKPKDNEDVLMLDTDNALPGFALLKKAYSSTFPCSSTTTADGNLICNRDCVMFSLCSLGQAANFYEINGPCLSNTCYVDTDMMFCLKCHTWPTVAKQWLLRFRPSGWPSQDIISRIVSEGCLLVPVGSKSSSSEGNPFEWRFSFSLAEKLLVHSLNHTQLLCYALLKIWLKEVLDRDNILKSKLCSYFMKTVMFWILEEDENLNWNPKNLLHCFLLCIDRLHYWIVCGYFPNYFIPEHNMIDGKLSRDNLAYLSLTLDKMMIRKNWKMMFLCPSLCNFSNFPKSIERQSHRLGELDEVVLSLQTFSSMMMFAWNDLRADSVSACIIYKMIYKQLPNSATKILTLMFLKENNKILASLNIANRKNKPGYLGYKECLSRILINTFYNAESGWLLLAAFFYSNQKYHMMSVILQLSSSMFSLKNRFEQNGINIESFREISKLKKMVYSGSFIKRMKHESSRVFYIDYCFRHEKYPFLTDEIPYEPPHSYSFLLFLAFLYSRKQGNSLGNKFSLELLKIYVEKDVYKCTNILWMYPSYRLLSKAFELLHDTEGVKACTFRYLKAFKLSYKFDALMKFMQENNEIKMVVEPVLRYIDSQNVEWTNE